MSLLYFLSITLLSLTILPNFSFAKFYLAHEVSHDRHLIAFRHPQTTRTWQRRSISISSFNDQSLSLGFTIQLRQCQLNELESLFWRVSNPNHNDYQQYLTAPQVDEMIRCDEQDQQKVLNWLYQHNIKSSQLQMTNSYIHVMRATQEQIETLFQTELHEFHHVLTHEQNKPLIRAVGAVTIPKSLSHIVEMVTGLTELIPVHKKRIVSSATTTTATVSRNSMSVSARLGSTYDEIANNMAIKTAASATTTTHSVRNNKMIPTPSYPNIYNYTDVFITPKILRRFYNMREDLEGQSSSNSHGIAAFYDYYNEDDLCALHTLLGRETSDVNNYLTPPQVEWRGPYEGGDTAESDLDTQYITLMAPGIKTVFWNHANNEWILNFAQHAVAATNSQGPWIWSLSYGWPEIGQCDGITSACSTFGYNYTQYIDRTNIELQKFGVLGVSILVSDGDDGASSFGVNCPIDARFPVGDGQGHNIDCPFADISQCRCGSLIVESGSMSCFLPLGVFNEDVDPTTHGRQCSTLLNATLSPACDQASTMFGAAVASGAHASNGYCNSTLDSDNGIFFSNCTCANIVPVTATVNGVSCTVSGYVYKSEYGSIFTPDFPTSSPYVTSVGATESRLDMGDACGTADVLADITTAETSCFKYGGHFSTGGGFSLFQSQPIYQSNLVQQYVQSEYAPPKQFFDGTKRGYPDIALNGHNYVVVLQREIKPIGGTSASSPALAGMFSLMNDVLLQNQLKPLGFLNPLLYDMYNKQPNAFNKIKPHVYDWSMSQPFSSLPYLDGYVAGDTNCSRFSCCQYGFRSSVSGWDPVTGLGTPNMLVIENYIRNLNNLPQVQPNNNNDNNNNSSGIKLWIVIVSVVVAFVVSAVLASVVTRTIIARRSRGSIQLPDNHESNTKYDVLQ